jgi:glycosyltransferase involved in cell wall biosynthesis
MKPQISVIIPIYNVEKYIAECLDSIVGQTLRDIEIVLVDDLGIDGSMKIASRYAEKDNRIKIIRREKNGGPSAARNTGIRNSSAPLIMFLDSDDFYMPAMCEKMLNGIEKSKADIAVCGINLIYETDKNMAESDENYYKIKFDGLRQMNDDILWNTDVSHCNKIFRRSVLEKYGIGFPEGLLYEDAYFFNAYACWAKSIFFVPELLYCYRRREGSTMNQTFNGKPGVSIDHVKIGIAFYEYLKKWDLFSTRRDYMMNFFFAYLNAGLRHEPTKRGKADIYDLANDFVRRECFDRNDVSYAMRRHLEMLRNRTLDTGKRKILGGIVSIKETPDKKKIYFLCVPVWKTKWTRDNIVKSYLFGFIRVVKRRIRYGDNVSSMEGVGDIKNRILNNLFSIRRSGRFKIITVLGLKLSLRRWKYYDELLRELEAHSISYGWKAEDIAHEIEDIIREIKDIHSYILCNLPTVRPRSILVAEVNDCHGEVIPGYVKYLLDLGYDNIDVLMIPELYKYDPLCRLGDSRIKILVLPLAFLTGFFSLNERIGKYETILLTSQVIYKNLTNEGKWETRIFDYFPALNEYRDKIVAVEHHVEYMDDDLLKRGKAITLADFNVAVECKISVNPHYFGEIKITPKSDDITNFVVVGALESHRRNTELLIRTILKLHKNEPGRFKITIIGRGNIGDIPDEIQRYFDIRGRVGFNEMFSAMEEADFFLCLLDPTNPEHNRYISAGTSGAFQLIYGFVKPCLIAEKFAEKYGFTNENSLVYTSNSDLAETMRRAIKMNSTEYDDIQNALKSTAAGIYQRSLETMRRIMGAM